MGKFLQILVRKIVQSIERIYREIASKLCFTVALSCSQTRTLGRKNSLHRRHSLTYIIFSRAIGSFQGHGFAQLISFFEQSTVRGDEMDRWGPALLKQLDSFFNPLTTKDSLYFFFFFLNKIIYYNRL